MSTKAGSQLARAVKIYLDIILILSLLACTVLAIWLLISPFVTALSQTEMDAAVPVAIGSRSIRPVIHLETAPPQDAGIQNLMIVDGRGELRFRTTSWVLQFVSNLELVIAALIVFTIIYLTRKVLQDVAKGLPFEPQNAKRIRVIGLLLLSIAILAPIVKYVAACFVLARIPTPDLALSPPLYFSSDAVIAGLLILILSQVWRHGAELASEQALTI